MDFEPSTVADSRHGYRYDSNLLTTEAKEWVVYMIRNSLVIVIPWSLVLSLLLSARYSTSIMKGCRELLSLLVHIIAGMISENILLVPIRARDESKSPESLSAVKLIQVIRT